jgi:2'-5' RNA ligase
MRLFTALDLPESIHAEVADLRALEHLDARWSPPSQYHVTLRFIGDVNSDRAAQFEEALGEVDAAPATCTPYGLDVLPSRQNPRVLILVLERTESLLSLYRDVSTVLQHEGLEPEDRTYRPHVTLARLDDLSPENVHVFLETHEAGSLASFQVESFHLYESTLTPDGAIHERRASFLLDG